LSFSLAGLSRRVDGGSVPEIVAGSGCSAYDSEFVFLAKQLNVPFVTSDNKVVKAFPDV
jgi:hypothetical protein